VGLGANALDRLGVANGTSAEIVGLDVRGRTMTVRPVDEDPPRTRMVWSSMPRARPSQ
jgi:hypothetical protein